MAIKDTHLSLPDLCNNYALLLSLLIAQIVLTCLWLLGAQELSLTSYGLWSLYVQSLVLINCAVLCNFRSYIQVPPAIVGGFIVVCIGVVSVLLVEYLASLLLYLNSPQWFDPETGRRMLVMAFTSALLLRVFSLLETLNSRSKAEVHSRMHALQAKIQPHFLFNSLNTISELTATNPKRAEDAIQALAMLFRVSLEESDNFHTLEKELRLCDRYIELETWRFSHPPIIERTVDVKNPQALLVPKLLLQPLIENALKYGIAAGVEPSKALIELSIKETPSIVSIKLRNTFKVLRHDNAGQGIALENIKERLSVLYQDQQSLKIKVAGDWFEVMIKLPRHFSALKNQ